MSLNSSKKIQTTENYENLILDSAFYKDMKIIIFNEISNIASLKNFMNTNKVLNKECKDYVKLLREKIFKGEELPDSSLSYLLFIQFLEHYNKKTLEAKSEEEIKALPNFELKNIKNLTFKTRYKELRAFSEYKGNDGLRYFIDTSKLTEFQLKAYLLDLATTNHVLKISVDINNLNLLPKLNLEGLNFERISIYKPVSVIWWVAKMQKFNFPNTPDLSTYNESDVNELCELLGKMFQLSNIINDKNERNIILFKTYKLFSIVYNHSQNAVKAEDLNNLLIGADLNATDSFGDNILNLALYESLPINLIEILLKQQINIFQKNNDGANALLIAAHDDDSNIFRKIFEKVILNDFDNINNFQDYGNRNLMHYLCSKGKNDLISSLLNKPGYKEKLFLMLFQPDSKGKLPIHLAIKGKGGFKRTVDIIINSCKGDNKILNLLNNKNSKGNNSLLLALKYKRVKIAKALIIAGADLTVRDNAGNTALHIICQAEYNKNGKGIEELIKKCIENITNDLIVDFITCKNNNECDFLDLLLNNTNLSVDNKVDVFLTLISFLDQDLQYCYLLDLYNLNKEAFNKCIEFTNSSGNTLLHLAVEKGDFEMVRHLLENGANSMAINNNSQTPSMLSTCNNSVRDMLILNCNKQNRIM